MKPNKPHLKNMHIFLYGNVVNIIRMLLTEDVITDIGVVMIATVMMTNRISIVDQQQFCIVGKGLHGRPHPPTKTKNY